MLGLSSSSSSAVVPGADLPEMMLYYLVGGSGVDPARRAIAGAFDIYGLGYAAFTASKAASWISRGWLGVHLQNPWGNTVPLVNGLFEGDQGLWCRDSADPNLQALFNGFAAAWAPYTTPVPRAGKLCVVAYIGSFDNVQRTDWDSLSDAAWAARRDEALAPVWAAGCLLGLDNTMVGIASNDRNRLWYLTLGGSLTLEPHRKRTIGNLVGFRDMGTDQNWEANQAVIVPNSPRRTVGRQTDPTGTAAEKRDAICAWAYLWVQRGLIPLIPEHLISATDTPATVYQRGAELFSAAPVAV